MKRVVMILAAMVLVFMISNALADDNVWALCDSYVNIRAKPSKNGQIIGYLDCGEGLETDYIVKYGWLHVINISCEMDEGWVKAEYMVDSNPEFVDTDCIVASNGRVALRKTVDGNRKAWVKNGETLHVLWSSSEWSLTNRGYIKTEFLEAIEND